MNKRKLRKHIKQLEARVAEIEQQLANKPTDLSIVTAPPPVVAQPTPMPYIVPITPTVPTWPLGQTWITITSTTAPTSGAII